MKPSRSRVGLTLLAFFAFLLAGCWDRREINDIAFVSATAVDQAGDKVRVTVQFPLPGQMGGTGSTGGGGGTAGKKPWHTETAEARTGREANVLQQEAMSRFLNFSHRRVLVIGEEKAELGIADVMDILGRISQNRMTAYPLISTGTAEEMFRVDASMERIPAETLRELAALSYAKPITIQDVVDALLTDGVDPYLPLIAAQKGQGADQEAKQARLNGIAVFRADKLVARFTGSKSKGLLFALEQTKQPIVTVKAPEGKGFISLRVINSKVKLDTRPNGSTPRLRLSLKGEMVASENRSTFRFSENQSTIARLEEAVNRDVERSIRSALTTTQELGADPVGFGLHLYRHHPAAWRKLRREWRDAYRRAELSVDVRIRLLHPGTITYPLGISKEDLER
ncbi:MAG TPA: Ger(x)C family spore germination protein [Paenibacillus sp.]|nr:Ger(x)C family spore germination protein [Paenibacillus sp.]